MNNNNPQKYKNTEIGSIPEDWEVKSMGEVCIKITDGTHDTPKQVESGIPFLTAIHVKPNNIDYENCYYLPEGVHRIIYNRCNPEKNDVLMVNIGAGVATTALINIDYEFSIKNVALLKPDNSKLKGAFLNYWQIKSKSRIINSISTGGAQPFLSLTQIGKLKIPIPTLTEQTAIATALSDADTLINSLEKLIEKKRNIKQGTMQKLLQPQEGWEVKKLGEVCNVNMGQSPLSEYYNKKSIGMPLIQGNADIENRKTIIRTYTSMITKRGKKDDIIMSVRAPVGEIAKATFDCCLGRGVCAISYKNEYIYHYLINIENTWSNISSGSTFDSVTSKQVNDLNIYIPKSELKQIEIATILSDMDLELGALSGKLAKLRAMKLGMMQELLTGRIRLIVTTQLVAL